MTVRAAGCRRSRATRWPPSLTPPCHSCRRCGSPPRRPRRARCAARRSAVGGRHRASSRLVLGPARVPGHGARGRPLQESGRPLQAPHQRPSQRLPKRALDGERIGGVLRADRHCVLARPPGFVGRWGGDRHLQIARRRSHGRCARRRVALFDRLRHRPLLAVGSTHEHVIPFVHALSNSTVDAAHRSRSLRGRIRGFVSLLTSPCTAWLRVSAAC